MHILTRTYFTLGFYVKKERKIIVSMVKVSVIVPIYHGKKYIESIIRQISDCVRYSAGEYSLELLFVNDDPDETIDIDYTGKCSEVMQIEVLETNQNRGIHAARVRGLKHCTGDYVLFLDQDDNIKPAYFASQLSHLGQADAVVCKLLHEGRQFYDTRMPFEQVVSREFMISNRNSIISPGQVLLRKDRIPAVWKKARLKNNGADDWLLWLCMFGAGQKFALNSEILFEHVVIGSNESINVEHMIASEQEVYEVLQVEQCLSQEELEKLQGAIRKATESHIKLLSKFQKMFFVYDDWLQMQEQGLYIYDYLKKHGVGSVAIYGDSYIGKRLYHNLRTKGINVGYFIDLNAVYLKEEIPVYVPSASLPLVDLVIICLVEGVENIKRDMAVVSNARIYSIVELLHDIRNNG